MWCVEGQCPLKLTHAGDEDGGGEGDQEGQCPSSAPMLVARMAAARVVRKAIVRDGQVTFKK